MFSFLLVERSSLLGGKLPVSWWLWFFTGCCSAITAKTLERKVILDFRALQLRKTFLYKKGKHKMDVHLKFLVQKRFCLSGYIWDSRWEKIARKRYLFSYFYVTTFSWRVLVCKREMDTNSSEGRVRGEGVNLDQTKTFTQVRFRVVSE